MSYLVPSIEMLNKLPRKLIFSFLNNLQIIFVRSAKLLELSNDLVLDLFLERNNLLFYFFIDDINFDLFISLPSFKDTLYYFCDLLMVLLLFIFFEELFIHDFIYFFMQNLIQFSLLHIIIILHIVEIFRERPKIACKVKPTSQCVFFSW
jgi:hypothetical protein